MPRTNVRMTRSEAIDFVSSQQKGHFASISANGYPHLTTVYHYVLATEKIAFWTFTKSRKITNVRLNSCVSLLVESGEEYGSLRGVCIVGIGSVICGEDEVTSLAFAMSESKGVLDSDRIERIRLQAAKRSVVIIEPVEFISWDHGKIQM